jgi:hypothetical protein
VSDAAPILNSVANDERSYAERTQDRRNERAMKTSAESAKATAKAVDDMLRLTRAQVEIARAARHDAERSERFTRSMAWSSLAVAVASLGAAVAALLMVR